MGTIIFFVIILSFFDINKKMVKNIDFNALITIFSIKRNMKFLFDINRKDNRLGCLDGIRTYLTFAIVLSHNYMIITLMTTDSERSLFMKNLKGFRKTFYNKLYLQHNFILISGSILY